MGYLQRISGRLRWEKLKGRDQTSYEDFGRFWTDFGNQRDWESQILAENPQKKRDIFAGNRRILQNQFLPFAVSLVVLS